MRAARHSWDYLVSGLKSGALTSAALVRTSGPCHYAIGMCPSIDDVGCKKNIYSGALPLQLISVPDVNNNNNSWVCVNYYGLKQS